MYYWLYPKYPPMRSYQFRMVRSALLANTLVCLPTGLGKTLIAAVVMYNYYRWFPQGALAACRDEGWQWILCWWQRRGWRPVCMPSHTLPAPCQLAYCMHVQ
jgi:hypothetical protein